MLFHWQDRKISVACLKIILSIRVPLRKCTVCGNINSEDQQTCGVCGSTFAGTASAGLELETLTLDSLREPATSKKSGGPILESRNKLWAGLAMLLLFIGLLVAVVDLFSYLPSTRPAGTAPHAR